MSATIITHDDTIYFRQEDISSDIEYSLNSVNWTPIVFNQFPITINNSKGSNINVLFTTDLDLSLIGDTVTSYFIAGTNDITFEGNHSTITLGGKTTWYGLIQNGTLASNGNDNIIVQNIIISSEDNISNGAGYICSSYFGKGATGNIIKNSSVINIPPVPPNLSVDNWGGICGSNIEGVEIRNCFTTCNISGKTCGGICGPNSNADIINCYSIGEISGENAGGICGNNCGSSQMNITNCYSNGNISGSDSGGISGPCTTPTMNIHNCYSSGIITGTAHGIVNLSGLNAGLIDNVYIAGDSGNTWSDVSANQSLLFSLTPKVWISIEPNIPYVLNITDIDYEPNTATESYDIGDLVNYNTFSIMDNLNYILLTVNDLIPPPSITVNPTDGELTFTDLSANTTTEYVVKVFSYTEKLVDIYYGYSICTFTLNLVPIANICFTEGTLITTDQGIIPIEKINCNIHTIHKKNIIAITKTISTDPYSICFEYGSVEIVLVIATDPYSICFEKNAFGDQIPSENTIVSVFHSVYDMKKQKMRKAHYFTEDYDKVYRVKYNKEILYNILMEKHEKIIVNNLICETLDPNDIIAKLYNPIKPEAIIDRKDNKSKQIINKEKIVKDKKIAKQKKSQSSNILILKKYLG